MIRKTILMIGCAAGLCLVFSLAVEAKDGAIENVRSTLERWIETEQVVAKQKQEWALGQDMLKDRIGLLQSEIESYQAKIKEAQASIGEADKKRGELIGENETLKALGEMLTQTAVTFEGRVRQLIPRLPEPIVALVKPLSQRLPDDPNETKLSLGLRYQNVIGILDAVNKFNREIKVVSEQRELPSGQTAVVTAMYIGLGQAYYTGANGTIAGVGRPSGSGWQWEATNELVGQVSDAIAILKNEKVASFVLLPVQVQ